MTTTIPVPGPLEPYYPGVAPVQPGRPYAVTCPESRYVFGRQFASVEQAETAAAECNMACTSRHDVWLFDSAATVWVHVASVPGRQGRL